MANLSLELAELNSSARELLKKHDKVFSRLDELSVQKQTEIEEIAAVKGKEIEEIVSAKLKELESAGGTIDIDALKAEIDAKVSEGLNAIDNLLKTGNVAQAENALKLGGKSLEEILAEVSVNKQIIVYRDEKLEPYGEDKGWGYNDYAPVNKTSSPNFTFPLEDSNDFDGLGIKIPSTGKYRLTVKVDVYFSKKDWFMFGFLLNNTPRKSGYWLNANVDKTVYPYTMIEGQQSGNYASEKTIEMDLNEGDTLEPAIQSFSDGYINSLYYIVERI